MCSECKVKSERERERKNREERGVEIKLVWMSNLRKIISLET